MKTKVYMKGKNILLGCLLAVLLFGSSASKAVSVWEHAYTPVTSFLNSVVNTSDGGYLSVGMSGYGFKVWVMIKTDFNGNLQWRDTIPYTDLYSSLSVVRELTPGNIYVLGTKDSTLHVLHYDLYDHLIDSNAYTLSGGKSDRLVPIDILPNGSGFTIGGQLNNDEVFKVELDASLSLISYQRVNPASSLSLSSGKMFTSFIRTPDNHYLMGLNFTNVTYMAHLSTTFTEDTTYYYGYAFVYNNSSAHRNYMVPTSDGNYFYAAREGVATKMRIYKVAPTGDTIWSRLSDVGIYLAPTVLGATPDGGCLAIAHYSSPYDMITLKFDSLGHLTKMSTIIKPSTDEFIDDIQPTADGHLIVCGASGTGPNYYPYLAKLDAMGDLYTNVIEGKVYYDVNNNCNFDIGETLIPNQFISISPASSYSISQTDGSYKFNVDTGAYSISIINGLDTNLWSVPCPASGHYDTSFTTNDYNRSSNKNFGFQANYLCSYLNVDIGSDAMRRCSHTHHYVSYSNTGTDTARAAYVEIVIDTPLYLIGCSIPFTNTDSLYRFDLGDLPPFSSGSFVIDDTLKCSAVIGSSLCLRADIYPTNNCAVPDTGIDNSLYYLYSNCVGDTSVTFTIRLRGSHDMDTSRPIRVYEDDILTRQDTIRLNVGGQSVFTVPISADKTYTLQADLDPRTPFIRTMQTHRELCGFSGTLPYPNYVLRFPQFDESPNFEIDCRAVTGSYDPNLKTVSPQGFRTSNFINDKQELEYTINFQNTGNDTALRIYILDTISPFLNIQSIRPGVSSHHYSWNVLEGNVVQFTFESIMLPDSGASEPNSHGFVKYKINQIPGNPKGTLIENTAGIYFDLNDPVMTNKAFNTIYDTAFISLSVPQMKQKDIQLLVYPNPSTDLIYFRIDAKQRSSMMSISFFDLNGQLMKTEQVNSIGDVPIDLRGFASGMYFYQLNNAEGLVATGKVMIQRK